MSLKQVAIPMAKQFFRMWSRASRALFHSKEGRAFIDQYPNNSGFYILYRNDRPYYIGKTGRPLNMRLANHARKPNARHCNFWNYFSAFQIAQARHRDEIEAILISAMPTANSAHPRFSKKKLDRTISSC